MNKMHQAHKGIQYCPYDEVEYDADGIAENRKIFHDFYRVGDLSNAQAHGYQPSPVYFSNTTPYRYMTQKEVRDFINYMDKLTA